MPTCNYCPLNHGVTIPYLQVVLLTEALSSRTELMLDLQAMLESLVGTLRYVLQCHFHLLPLSSFTFLPLSLSLVPSPLPLPPSSLLLHFPPSLSPIPLSLSLALSPSLSLRSTAECLYRQWLIDSKGEEGVYLQYISVEITQFKPALERYYF